MGLAPDAELIWGYPVARYKKDDFTENPLFAAVWNEEYDWWNENLPGQLKVHSWGHCDDPDGPHGIITGSEIKTFRADAWKPKEVNPNGFNLVVTDETVEELNALAREAGIPYEMLNFYNGTWWLVASYG